MGYPKNGWFRKENSQEWMITGATPDFRKPPYCYNCSFWHPDLGRFKHLFRLRPTNKRLCHNPSGWHDSCQPSNSVQNHSGRERNLPKRRSVSRVSGRFIWCRSCNFCFDLRNNILGHVPDRCDQGMIIRVPNYTGHIMLNSGGKLGCPSCEDKFLDNLCLYHGPLAIICLEVTCLLPSWIQTWFAGKPSM